MSKMSKEEIAGLITEKLKTSTDSVFENIKKDIATIESDKNDLYSGTKNAIGKIRKSAQSLKSLSQELRKQMLEIRSAIEKK